MMLGWTYVYGRRILSIVQALLAVAAAALLIAAIGPPAFQPRRGGPTSGVEPLGPSAEELATSVFHLSGARDVTSEVSSLFNLLGAPLVPKPVSTVRLLLIPGDARESVARSLLAAGLGGRDWARDSIADGYALFSSRAASPSPYIVVKITPEHRSTLVLLGGR